MKRYIGFILSLSLLFTLMSTNTVYAAGVVGMGTPESCDEAALDAALAGGGAVTFNCGASPVTITVTSTKTISADTTIDGANLVTISGGGTVSTFEVSSSEVTFNLNNLAIINGIDNLGLAGAIINSHGGTVNITNSNFSNNTSNGGVGVIFTTGILNIMNSTFLNNGGTSAFAGAIAIQSTGTVHITGSTFSGNTAGHVGGGAILNDQGTLIITNTTFANNSHNGTDGGGAIYNDGGTTSITGSTFIGNSTTSQGGAILDGGGFGTSPLTIANSTFFGNTAGTLGGAIHNGCVVGSCFGGVSGTTTIINSTFSGNSAASGDNLSNNAGSVTLVNTIIANGLSGGNCSGVVISNGNNLDSGNTCGFTASGDWINTDPMLDPLAYNGGQTQTMALSPSSLAIDAGNDTYCAATPVNGIDQRGVTRPQGAFCDIGSFEYEPPQLTAINPAKVWIGLKNSDDVGTKFDLLAEVYKDGTLIGSGQLNKVNGGSSGFNNAKLNTIPLTLFAPVSWSSSSTLSIKLSVRNTCFGNTHNSGTARFWYNDASANSQFGAMIEDVSQNYFFRDGFALGITPGSGPKKTIDIAAGAPCSPYKLFGTWSIMP